jgi:protein subunit release factor A
MLFLDKLAEIERKYEELTAQLSSSEVLADPSRYQKTAKALSDISEVVEKFRQWKAIDKSISGARELLADASTDEKCRALARRVWEMDQQRVRGRGTQGPDAAKDPNDEKNVVLGTMPEPGAMKPRSSPMKCSACIRATRNHKHGKWRSFPPAFRAWAD